MRRRRCGWSRPALYVALTFIAALQVGLVVGPILAVLARW